MKAPIVIDKSKRQTVQSKAPLAFHYRSLTLDGACSLDCALKARVHLAAILAAQVVRTCVLCVLGAEFEFEFECAPLTIAPLWALLMAPALRNSNAHDNLN